MSTPSQAVPVRFRSVNHIVKQCCLRRIDRKPPLKRPGGDSAEALVDADIMGGNSADGAAPAARPEIILMRAAMAKLRRRVADLEAFDPNRIENRKDLTIEALSNRIDTTLLQAVG